MKRYREPPAVTWLVYIYHFALICVAAGAWLESVPYRYDSPLDRIAWALLFGIAGASGLGARIAQGLIDCRWKARVFEAWVLTFSAALWLLLAMDLTITAHAGERQWRVIASLVAAATAAAIIGITEASYTLQRLRVARWRETLIADTAHEMRVAQGDT